MKEVGISAAALIQDHRDELIRFVRPMVGAAKAEDVVQEAFFRISAALGRNPIKNPKSYLFKIAANLARDELRRQRRLGEQSLDQIPEADGAQPTAAEDAAQQEQLEMLRDAISELPRKCRRIFIARKYEGRSYREIARLENVSEKTVENHISRAIKLVRDKLNRRMS